MIARPASLALALALTACGATSIGGTVGADRVNGARDVIFDEVDVDVPLLGTFRFMAIFASDMPDACVALDEFYDNPFVNCEEACEDLGQLANEDLGRDDYWVLSMGLVANPDRVAGAYAWSDQAWSSENEFTSSLVRLDIADLYDLSTCVQDCDDGDQVIDDDEYPATGGTLTLDAYVDGESIDGSFDVQFDAGEAMDGKFRARRCPEISDWFTF